MRILLATGEQYAGGLIPSLKRSGHEFAGIISPARGLFIESSWRPRPLYFRWRFGTIKSHQSRQNIPVRVCNSLSDGSLRTWITSLRPDLLLVLGWPNIIPENFLAQFPQGGINIHPSVLPLLRGADPIFSSVLNNAKGYGITFHKMEAEIDKGNVILQKPLNREDDDSYETLYFRFLRVAIKLTPLVMKALQSNSAGVSQSGTSSKTTRFHWRYTVYAPDDSPEKIVRKTLACYSHHKMIALFGKTLFSFTHCTKKKGLVSCSVTTPVIRSVGLRAIVIQHEKQLLALSGITLIGTPPWLSPLRILQRLKKGQFLESVSATRRTLRDSRLKEKQNSKIQS